MDWHPVPPRQYTINLDAGVKIAADEVLLVEHTTGKGHPSQHVEGKIHHSIFVPVG